MFLGNFPREHVLAKSAWEAAMAERAWICMPTLVVMAAVEVVMNGVKVDMDIGMAAIRVHVDKAETEVKVEAPICMVLEFRMEADVDIGVMNLMMDTCRAVLEVEAGMGTDTAMTV